jgi:GPI ethanolamine phosphate transferase 3 subunit O
VQITERLIEHGGPGGMHEDTLLLVLGDHGQTMTGDHGGGSPEELDSMLLAINLRAAASSRSNSVASEGLAKADWEGGPRVAQSQAINESCIVFGAKTHLLWPEVPQIDFAASVSVMLGQPIPAENVGACPHKA